MDEDGQELPDDRDESDTEDFDLLPPLLNYAIFKKLFNH